MVEQTGQSEEIHSRRHGPKASSVGSGDLAGILVDGGGLDRGDLVLAQALADDL